MVKPTIGIDPGKSGGFAIWTPTQKPIALHNMPETEGDIVDLLRDIKTEWPDAVAYLEQVGGFVRDPKEGGQERQNRQPGSAMFNFGANYGFLKGCCSGLAIPLFLVPPVRWQKDLRIPMPTGLKQVERKRRLKQEAQQRHPDPQLRITNHTADALLILDWALESQRRAGLAAHENQDTQPRG
jgi:hypothetical protein